MKAPDYVYAASITNALAWHIGNGRSLRDVLCDLAVEYARVDGTVTVDQKTECIVGRKDENFTVEVFKVDA